MPFFSRVPAQVLVPSFATATAGAAAAPIIPTTDLALWLRADTGVTLVGGNVSAWLDNSSTGYDVGQATPGERPGYISSNSSLNNQPSIEVTSFQNLIGPQFGVPSGHPLWAPDMTIFVMAEVRSPWSTFATLVSVTSNTSWLDGWAIGSRDSSGNLDFWFNGWNNRIYQSGVITGLTTSRKVLAVGRANSATSQLLYRLNGVQIGTTSYGSQITNATSYLTVSGAPGNVYQAIESSIAEIIVYNRSLTDPEISTVEGYLTGKYGAVTPV